MLKIVRRVWRVLWGFVCHVIESDSIGIAASTAFFFLVALFPLLMATNWLLNYYHLSLNTLEGFLPASVIELFETGGLSAPSRKLLPILLAIWGASTGVWSLMKGIYKSYTGKALSSIRARLTAILFTVCFVVVLALTLAFIAIGRWSNLIMISITIFFLLLALYFYTPGTSAKFGRSVWTAALTTGAWLLTCWGFEIYMRYFASYDALYGSLGAFLGLALWVFVISFVTILGAALGGYNPPKEN